MGTSDTTNTSNTVVSEADVKKIERNYLKGLLESVLTVIAMAIGCVQLQAYNIDEKVDITNIYVTPEIVGMIVRPQLASKTWVFHTDFLCKYAFSTDGEDVLIARPFTHGGRWMLVKRE